MTLVTKKGKYAKYRSDAFSKLALMTFELLRKNGAWSEITRNRVNAGLFTFEGKSHGPQLANVNVYFEGSLVARFNLSHFLKPTFLIYADDTHRNYNGVYLESSEAELISDKLREMTKSAEKEKGYIFNQHFKANQNGIHYWFTLKDSKQFEFIWGNPE